MMNVDTHESVETLSTILEYNMKIQCGKSKAIVDTGYPNKADIMSKVVVK